MDVRMDRIPANAEELATIIQFTSPSATDVPIVAMAVCAKVFTILTRLARHHFFVKILLMV